jgi:hypothetical protein
MCGDTATPARFERRQGGVGGLPRDREASKTELIADRIWRSRSQLELASVAYVLPLSYVDASDREGAAGPVEALEALAEPEAEACRRGAGV